MSSFFHRSTATTVDFRHANSPHFRLTMFDASYGEAYREHVFLSHPLVPKEILQSQSEKEKKQGHPKLDKKDFHSCVHSLSITLTVTPMDSETRLTGEFWSKTYSLK